MTSACLQCLGATADVSIAEEDVQQASGFIGDFHLVQPPAQA